MSKALKNIFALAIFILCTINSIVAQNDKYFVHTVSKGQTLYSISRMYEVSIDDIIALNPECAQKLAIGYKLKIAQSKKSTSSDVATTGNNESRYHTIQAGETLYRLSQKYNITPTEICNANPGLSINNFRTGEVILIPRTQTVAPQPEATEKIVEKNDKKPEIRTTHKVEKGETIYSITKLYGITEEELLAANP
ncbi:MAG: LysM peptidoglycan-binding domain-containing protein, partial [Bacteroidaceae bacterium]|nr:LysM peptidoglycan-binding domain-containing protein [Bacteroidaceae bacterium]